ncbi:MAG TPA: ATP-grasp domain-containing protein [Synergistaceae bacterium]|nr:ATP-grasp domain-containing protein [Synergistaceae bacterium]HPJ24534.1 ATP-grasp domain-containing protein [Synergistaceae bacterium]HPQ36291.1 ATP-grasp domain-containing protein [Synergistaceae bacterium]
MWEQHKPPLVVVLAGREPTSRSDVLDVLRCRQSVIEALESQGYRGIPVDLSPRDLRNRGRSLLKKLEKLKPACIFNLFEGFSFDAFSEIAVCSLLEHFGIPFTGNGSRTLGLCLDKDRAKKRLASAGLPVPRGYALKGGQKKILSSGSLEYPLFLKPQHQDGSLGIGENSLVRTPKELEERASLLLREFPQGILVEEFLSGSEYSVAFTGNREYHPMGISVIDYGQGEHSFLSYDSKWTPSSREFTEIQVFPEDRIPSPVKEHLFSLAARTGACLGCRGYFRVDFREHRGVFRIIDVNPNPDINEDSGFVRQCGNREISYEDLISRLVTLGMEEGERNPYGVRTARKMRTHGGRYRSLPEGGNIRTPGSAGSVLGSLRGLQTSG